MLDKFQPGLSSSQLKCGPSELVFLMTCCMLIRFDANLMYVAQLYWLNYSLNVV
jgi:hypothetical protein